MSLKNLIVKADISLLLIVVIKQDLNVNETYKNEYIETAKNTYKVVYKDM